MATHDQDKTNLTGFELLYGQQLSKQELFEIEQNAMGVFNLLFEIDRRKREEAKNPKVGGKGNKC